MNGLINLMNECGNHETKAGYTATLVACGWAGAAKKSKRWSDRLTNRPTDRWTERVVESRAPDLKCLMENYSALPPKTHEVQCFKCYEVFH